MSQAGLGLACLGASALDGVQSWRPGRLGGLMDPMEWHGSASVLAHGNCRGSEVPGGSGQPPSKPGDRHIKPTGLNTLGDTGNGCSGDVAAMPNHIPTGDGGRCSTRSRRFQVTTRPPGPLTSGYAETPSGGRSCYSMTGLRLVLVFRQSTVRRD